MTNAAQFQQLNLKAVIDRAQTILLAIKDLTLRSGDDGDMAVINIMLNNCDVGDDWERAAINLAKLELMERQMRREDPNCESAPSGWNGGLR